LDLDRLPENQAVDLIRRYQPGQAFASPEHEAAACEIVRELSGLTLAVETAAVYLGQCDRRVLPEEQNQHAVDVRNYLTKLREDLKTGGSEGVMSQLREVTATLRPTLARLDAPARTVLQIASLLPSDSVALPWVRALVGQSHPELAADAATGESDPWTQLIRGLIGMRLFQPTAEPRVVAIHRILQRVLESELPEGRDALDRKLVALAFARSEKLEKHWHELAWQWEITPLTVFVDALLNRADVEAPRLVKWLCEWFPHYDSSSVTEHLISLALRQQESDPKTEPTELSITLSNLGNRMCWKGKPSDAEPVLRRALELEEQHRPPTHHFISIRLNNLAMVLRDTNRLADAVPLLRRALAIVEGDPNLDASSLAISISNLGNVLARLGQNDEAERLLRRALSLFESSVGLMHPYVSIALSRLSVLLNVTNRIDEAVKLARRALIITENCFNQEHPHLATDLNNLAVLLKNAGMLDEAEPMYRRAIAIREVALGADNPDTLESVGGLASLLDATGRFVEATSLRRRVLEEQERKHGAESPDVLRNWNNHCHALRKQGQPALAEANERRTLALSAKVLGDAHQLVIHRRNNLVLTLVMLGKFVEARQILALNWHLNAPPHANTTPRIAFLWHVIALSESQPDTPFLSQLKTLLTGPELPMACDVAVSWDIAYFIEFLKPRLGERSAEVLTSLVAALNDRTKLPALDQFPEWRNAIPQPLD